jgi:ethanolamine-phosphate cytidylyltransferase
MAVEACRWVTKAVPKAPYVTSLPWISHYGCNYVVHGDDITSDSNGMDCYRFVKQAGRFKVVKRTPGISTTDLVGRMLLCTKTHFILSLRDRLAGQEGPGNEEERKRTGAEMEQRIKDYATDATGLAPGCDVWYWHASRPVKERRTTQSSSSGPGERRPSAGGRQQSIAHHHAVKEEKGKFAQMVHGKGVKPGQAVVYVDGGWDLFSSGHIEFLRSVTQIEEEAAVNRGWYTEAAKAERIEKTGEDYGPTFLVAGVHDDEVINHWKGVNYPIMNIFERGLCVLQCKVSSVFQATPVLANAPLVHPLGSLWLTLLHFQSLPAHPAIRHSFCCLSWQDIIHALDVRSSCSFQGIEPVPRGRQSRFPECECWRDCRAHHERKDHV